MKKKFIEALNEKARAIERLADGEEKTAEALGKPMPQGCTTIFDTGWETNPRPTYPIGNCQASVSNQAQKALSAKLGSDAKTKRILLALSRVP